MTSSATPSPDQLPPVNVVNNTPDEARTQVDWNSTLPVDETAAEDDAIGEHQGMVQVHWSLTHAGIIKGAAEALCDIDDLDARTWLGNLWLTYQQQCGDSATDFAMAFTEVDLTNGGEGPSMTLLRVPSDYNIQMLETDGDYYVLCAEPLDQSEFLEMASFQLDQAQTEPLMLGRGHARARTNDLTGALMQGVVEYFGLGEDEDIQLNPMINVIRVMLLSLGERGFAPTTDVEWQDFVGERFTFSMAHRELELAHVIIRINLNELAAQFANMVRQVQLESQANQQGLVHLGDAEK